MKQNPIPSQTAPVLVKDPSREELCTYAKSFFSNLCAILLLLISTFALICMLRSCADDTETQAAQAHAYNAQFSRFESNVQVVEAR